MLSAVAACGVEQEEAHDEAIAYVGSTSMIPADGQCAHITMSRLSDFASRSYRGPLAGAMFSVATGENLVTATAYAEPCDQPPTKAPWIATDQITTFAGGANVLVLDFHPSSSVTIEPIFETERTLAARAGSSTRLLRNGEDAAGPSFALDGWNVTQLSLPPAEPSETVVFSMRGQGNFSSVPRGLARLPDGTFLAQQWHPLEPLRAFSPVGMFLGSWPVISPPDMLQWDWTEGLEAIDATHLVRTANLSTPIHCDSEGEGCIQVALEILELQTDTNGAPVAVVTEQILLPEPFNLGYAPGVAKIGANYAVTLWTGTSWQMILIAPDGALVAGPIDRDGEGLFDAGDGRLGTLTYDGLLDMFDADGTARPGESTQYDTTLGTGYPFSLAWNPSNDSFLMLTQHRTLISAPADFSSFSQVPIDLSAYSTPAAMDYFPFVNQVVIADRIPPLGDDGQRLPRVDFYDLATSERVSSVTLQGVPSNLRLYSLAFNWPRAGEIVSHYRVPGNAASSIDSIFFTHHSDGTLASFVDLRRHGIRRILTVNLLPATGELVFTATDISGQVRMLVTNHLGQPLRSYRTSPVMPIVSVSDLASITSGPYAGDVGAVSTEPAEYLRLVLE